MKISTIAWLFCLVVRCAAAELDYYQDSRAFHRDIAGKIRAQWDSQPAGIKTCLERLRNLVLSDRVAFYFNVSAAWEKDQLILSGEVERPEFKHLTRGVFKALGFTSVVDRVEIVPDPATNPEPFGVAVAPHVLTWSRPDLSGIPMDEALFGEPVYVLKELPGALLIKTFNGYWGYAVKAGIRRLAKSEFIRLLNQPKVTLLKDFAMPNLRLPGGCQLLFVQERADSLLQLRGPGGEEIAIPASLGQRNQRERELARVLEAARAFLKAPYNLGGKNSVTGIDCSAIIQLSYRTIGVNLPRDAKQQYLGGHLILPCVKEALLPGDAIFFIGDRGQVDHTALYLGNQDLLHATGAEVKIQSLNPAATNYFKRFDGDFLGAKRFWW